MKLRTFSMGFLHGMSSFIFNTCSIMIFVMVIII